MTAVIALLVFVVAGALMVASVVAARAAGLHNVFARVARHYQGEARQDGVWGWPTAHFPHREATARVSIVRPAGVLGPRATQIAIDETPWLEFVGEADSLSEAAEAKGTFSRRRPKFTCQITPAGFIQRTAYLFGGRSGLSGSPQFDLQYCVETDDREQAARLLTRYVQVQVDRLRFLQGGNDIYVLFQDGMLIVQRRGVMRNERLLRQFVAFSLELYEQAAASFGVGIEIVATVKNEAQAVCKVCGDHLDNDDIVYCRVCDTPHHRDCWRYFGSCSVYACGERRYARAPRARSVT